MAVETVGTVAVSGDTGPPVPVRVFADSGRLRLETETGSDVLGDWIVSEIGLTAQADGFLIRAEGEELYLRADADASVAEELGVVAASPRMARRVSALHKPEERPEPEEVPVVKTHFGAIGFALAGALVLLGGSLLALADGTVPRAAPLGETGVDPADFWLAFVIGGLLMVAVSVIMALGRRWARVVAVVAVTAVVVAFGYVIANSAAGSSHLTAYGFIAGGMVVAVAVLFSGSIRDTE